MNNKEKLDVLYSIIFLAALTAVYYNAIWIFH